MRNLKSLIVFSIVLISYILSSCSSMNTLTMSVTEPAPVHIPSDVKTIGIIDRSLPSKKNEVLDAIDKILSVEGKNLDKDGANASVNGLFDELSNNSKFSEIKIIDVNSLRSPGLGIFPSPVPWSKIDIVCQINKVDIVFALSYYDTDAKVSYQTDTVEITGPAGLKIPAIEHHAKISTLIKTGWRIYDPATKSILDEYWMNRSVSSSGKGINPMKAVQAIMKRKEDVLHKSSQIGHTYAQRVNPYHTRVSRKYYVKGTNNFEIGKRRAQAGQWDGAAELWEKEVSNPEPKIAGRACYNMAIINEINGNLNTAVEWATKAYTDYEDKAALSYIKVLQYRIQQNEILQKQME